MQLLAMIGEQFDEGDEICGAVVSVRRAQDKIAIWTKTASNEAAQVGYYDIAIMFQIVYRRIIAGSFRIVVPSGPCSQGLLTICMEIYFIFIRCSVPGSGINSYVGIV